MRNFGREELGNQFVTRTLSREDIFELKFSDLLLESIFHWALGPGRKSVFDKYWLKTKDMAGQHGLPS